MKNRGSGPFGHGLVNAAVRTCHKRIDFAGLGFGLELSLELCGVDVANDEFVVDVMDAPN